MAGLNNAQGDFIITMDDDLQHSPEFFPKILDFRRNFLCSSRMIDDINRINKKIVKEIINYKGPNVYLDGLIIKSTKNIGMIEVDHFARRIGESNYTLKKLFLLWSNMVLNFSFLLLLLFQFHHCP